MSRKNISLTEPIEERANEVIRERGFTGLSDMIAVLVREEFERRGLVLKDAPSSTLEEAEKKIVDAVETHYGKRKPRKSGK